MGRELRRVPLDFEWPLHETWAAYLPPEHRGCPDCEGGQPYAAWWMQSILGLVSVLADASETTDETIDRTGQIWPHPYLQELPNAPGFWMEDDGVALPGDQRYLDKGKSRVYRLTPVRDYRLKKLMDGLGSKDDGFFGRNISSDGYRLTRVLLDAAGMDHDEFFKCTTCDGSGIHPADLPAYRAWEERYEKDPESFEPPKGDGYQLWETTSEGSPISPVFGSLDELCEYAEANCATFGSAPDATAEQWRKMLDDGFVYAEIAPGMIVV